MSAELHTSMPNGIYHGLPNRWGHTMLDATRSSMVRAYAEHVTRSVPSRKSDAFTVGNATHCRVLEPERFGEEWTVGPCNDRRRKAWKDAVAELPAGTQILTPSQHQMVVDMGEAVREHPVVGPMLEREGLSESSILWTDEQTGLQLKARPDRMVTPGDGPGVILDIKTTKDDASPEDVAREFVKRGYHRQQALYCEGFKALFGEHPAAFVFAFVSKQPPHEVSAFVLDDTSAELGESQRRSDIERVAAAMGQEGSKREAFRQPWNINVGTLVLPSYAHFEE